MEKIMKVVSQGQYVEREWENQNHEKKLLCTVELQLTDGNDSLIAEANGDTAKLLAQKPLQQGCWYPFIFSLVVSSWQRQDNTTAWATRVRITKIGSPITLVQTF